MAVILNNQQSTVGSPYAYYTIDATTSNRTATTTDIAIIITTHLGSSASTFGTGYSLKGSLYLNGSWYDIPIKSTSEAWSGTTNHTASATFTVPTDASLTSISGILFNVTRPDGRGSSCSLTSTGCSNITLPPQPVSIPTVNENTVTLGTTELTVYTNRTNPNYIHTIQTVINGNVIETFTNITDSKTFIPAIATYAPYITGSDRDTCYIVCTTYNNGTQIGTSQTVSITLIVPDSVRPSVAISYEEANPIMLELDWGVFVQGKSQLAITLTPTLAYNSPIASYVSSVRNDGITYYYTQNYTTNVLTASGSTWVDATVTDQRGHSPVNWETTPTFNVVEYSNPQITTATATRCLADGTESSNGTYLKYTFVGSISPVNNNNDKRFRIGYKLKSASSYTYVAVTTNSYTRNNQSIVLSGVTFSDTNAYDIIFEATDSFTTTAITREIGTAPDIINVSADGKSIAFGKTSEKSNAIELGLTTYYKDKEIANSDDISGLQTQIDTVSSTATTANTTATNALNKATTNEGNISTISAVINAMNDYIVEKNTSGNWTYVKLNSGIAIAWGSFTKYSIAINSATGSCYRCADLQEDYYPSGLFTSVIYRNATFMAYNCLGWAVTRAESDINAIRYYLLTSSTSVAQDRAVNHLVIGTWK